MSKKFRNRAALTLGPVNISRADYFRLVVLACLLAACAHKDEPGDTWISPEKPVDPITINLNNNWQFHRVDSGKKIASVDQLQSVFWQEVSLPHSARIEPRIVNNQWQGDAFYRRTIVAPPAWKDKKVFIRFEGAMNKADVWLNGQHVMTHQGGYLPFVIDLSDELSFESPNWLVVKLDNRDNSVTGPKPLEVLDFNMYGGLYRGVNLLVKPPLYITDQMLANQVGGGGIFVSYPEVSTEQASVSIQTHIANDSGFIKIFTVKQSIIFAGELVAESETQPIRLEPGANLHKIQQLKVDKPSLWSPKAPHLHQLLTTIRVNGVVVDSQQTQIGIRCLKFVDNRLTINGKQQFLRGVNRHQEYPYVGYAISPQADYRDAKLIKEAGFDYVRLSHYPHSPAFMEAADELGLVLLDAILGWQYYNPDLAFREHVLQTCRDLIRRDRNHPSVIAWECSLNESPMPQLFVDKLHQVVHEEYPGDQAFSAGWVPEGYDIYLQSRQHRLLHPEIEIPVKPYIVSEYGDWEYYAQNAGLNQDAWSELAEEARNSRQLLSDGENRLLQQATNLQEAHNDNRTTPAFADSYWVMFDYNRGYANDLEASGITSIERIPKPAFYFYRSQRDADELSPLYKSGSVVHIANEWQENSPRAVRIFSNGDEVELFLNGTLLGRQMPDDDHISKHLRHPPFTFNTDFFVAGTLEAVAYKDNKEIARHSVSTPGAPAGVVVDLATEGVALRDKDLVFAHARIVDKNGTRVPVSGIPVAFMPTQGAEIIGPQLVLSKNGTATVLVRIIADKGQSKYISAQIR